MASESLIRQIHDRFGDAIDEATSGTLVEPAVLAAFIYNESGRDRAGRIKTEASRFEKHVNAALLAVRDGRRRAYGSITREDLAGASDAAVRALASSFGVTQIMGYHVIDSLTDVDGTPVTVSELRDPGRHLGYAVQLLVRTSRADLVSYQKAGGRAGQHRALERILRRWNTGSPTGKTYHSSYVPNGLAAHDLWLKLCPEGTPAPTIATVVDVDVDTLPEVEESEARPADPEPEPQPQAEAPAPVDQPTAQAAAVPVTAGSASWIRSVVTWIGGLGAMATDNIQQLLGISPDVQKLLLVGGFVLGVTWLLLKFFAERQVRSIAADPEKVTVK